MMLPRSYYRADQLDEERGFRIVQRQVAYFIDYQGFRRQMHAHPAILPTFAIRLERIEFTGLRSELPQLGDPLDAYPLSLQFF